EIDAQYKSKLMPEKRPAITFAEYMDKYYIPHFMRNKSAKKRKCMMYYYYNLFGNHPLDKVTPPLIEQSVLNYSAGKSVSTFNHSIILIHSIFQYAIEIELMDRNPVKIKRSNQDTIRRRFLDKEEREALLKECKLSNSPWLLSVVQISLLAGLRLNEIKTLRREDIRDGHIHIRSDVAKSKQSRAIPMNDELAAIIAHSDFDFNHSYNRPFSKAVQRAGLKDVRFHDLRRTFGSMLAQAGVPIFDISKLMGHAKVQVTAKVYAHLLPENLQSAVSKISILSVDSTYSEI
ncbi:MAG: site-specific integrase, partial [Syntrophomonadaceae bacterium]|nr:site-specific integrase [Syntrophomonadaceae bacterium]